jgi:CHAT domain-containing protein
MPRVPDSVLALGDPVIDRQAWPSLSDLPATRREALEVGRLYPRSEVLLGAQATPDAFLHAAARFEVLHLAAHATANPRHPSLSALIFAAPQLSGTTGALYARDLETLRLPATRLVFLAACGSLSRAVGQGPGVSSLARAFLAAGVPSVVGSLWRVNDDATRPLAVSFHQAFRSGLSPSAALRAAQIEQLSTRSGSKDSLAWAAFENLGS